jgi:hypothetical protein
MVFTFAWWKKRFCSIDITMSKRRKTLQRATKLATENGGGIYSITEGALECADSKVN